MFRINIELLKFLHFIFFIFVQDTWDFSNIKFSIKFQLCWLNYDIHTSSLLMSSIHPIVFLLHIIYVYGTIMNMLWNIIYHSSGAYLFQAYCLFFKYSYYQFVQYNSPGFKWDTFNNFSFIQNMCILFRFKIKRS